MAGPGIQDAHLSSCFPSPSITKPKMAFRAEDKFAASATEEASKIKVDVDPERAHRPEDKFVASATDEPSEVKANVEPKVAYRVEDIIAAPFTDEAFEVEDIIAAHTDEASEDKDDVVPEAAGGEADGEAASVHIVHLIRPGDEEPEAFDIRMLASVVGSEDAAKEAVVYHYTHAASGFSARLTPKQVAHLSEKPEVLVVTPDKVCQLIR